MIGIRWTAAEIDYLERLVGDVPFPVLVRRMKIPATANGWPDRSDKAISQRIRRTGQASGARHGDWTTTGGVGEILGCPGTRVEAWRLETTIEYSQGTAGSNSTNFTSGPW